MNKSLKQKKYIKFYFAKILILCSPIVRLWEKKYIKRYSSIPLKHQAVFIIGAPRTGSTILYQTLTNQLNVLYIDNLVCRFNKNLFFGFWLSHKIFKQKAHNCFKSNHGNTSKCGLHAPSECGGFWYRWLPKDKHFIDYDDITDKMVKEIREEITAIINYFDKPLVFNNNNIALRIRLIKKAFPNAKFIVADREPLFVAQSILNARMKFYSNYNQWWSIMPNNYVKLLEEPYFRQVVLQHYHINKQMYKDLIELISNNNHVTIHYKDFCANKDKTVEEIINLLNYKKVRLSFINNEVKESRKLSIEEYLLHKIEIEIERLDWNDYTS
jgi:hypothetical protein